jgi:[ribosomal protein S5]-alanine N-acetyltransferase
LVTAINGNSALEIYMKVVVPMNWTEFGTSALQYAVDRLNDVDEAGWWTYFPIHKQHNKLIGSGGYKGKPTDDGIVEIGYEISSEYRNRGLATEFVNALVGNAFSFQKVCAILAHTLGENNASTKVLLKCGFRKVAQYTDPEDGLLWKWELKRT